MNFPIENHSADQNVVPECSKKSFIAKIFLRQIQVYPVEENSKIRASKTIAISASILNAGKRHSKESCSHSSVDLKIQHSKGKIRENIFQIDLDFYDKDWSRPFHMSVYVIPALFSHSKFSRT